MIPFFEVIADSPEILAQFNAQLDMIFLTVCMVIGMTFYFIYFILRWAQKHDNVLAEPAAISDDEKIPQ